MRLLHVIPSISPREGGPSVAIHLLARAVLPSGIEIHIASTADGRGDEFASMSQGVLKGVKYHLFPRNTDAYKVSWGLASWMKQHIATFDLIHIHALFSFSSTAVARIAAKKNVPYIVRPLGVLNRWGFDNRRPILKRISYWLNERKILSHASAIHYTSEAERAEAIRLDYRFGDERAAVIPIPVEIAAPEINPALFFNRVPAARDRQVILFLSRIDQKKGLDLLLEAFAILCKTQRDLVLVIAGNGDWRYVNSLKSEATRLGVDFHVCWPGFLNPAERTSAFAAAKVFVLPSYSENFGISAAEALNAGVPTILTEQVGIAEYVRRYDAGVVTTSDAMEIAKAIQHLLNDRAFAEKITENGRRLVREQFSPEIVGANLTKLYRSIVDH